VSGSDDFTIKVWELPTFELLQTFSHHTGPITWLFPPPSPHRQHNQPLEGWDNTYPIALFSVFFACFTNVL
jgi:hypothetical protein